MPRGLVATTRTAPIKASKNLDSPGCRRRGHPAAGEQENPAWLWTCRGCPAAFLRAGRPFASSGETVRGWREPT